MKKIILSLSLLTALGAKAQDLNTHYQYQMNWFNINPAYTGSEDGTQFILNPGTQWVGIEGNPTNSMFGINSRIANNNGIGFKAIIDSRGIFNNFTAEGVYKYQVQLKGKHFLNFGVSAGYYQTYLQQNTLIGDQYTDQSDVTLTQGNYNSSNFLAGFGAMCEWENLELGLSLPHLVVSGRPISDHIFALGKYRQAINKDFDVIPSVVFQYLNKSPYLLDGGLAFEWRKMLWLKGTYRTNGNILAGLGVRINDFQVGYTYSAVTGDFQALSASSHEVFLAFTIKNKRGNKILGGFGQRRANQNLMLYMQEVQTINNSPANTEVKAELNALQTELRGLLQKSQENKITAADKQRMREIEDKIEELKQQVK